MTAKLRPRSRGVRFLVRDSFLVDAASVVGTRAAVPGPGTLTTTDTNARMSISGGALVKNGALNINDVFHYTSTYVVAPGVAMGIIWKTISTDSGRYGLGYRTDSPSNGVTIRSNGVGAFRLYSSTDSIKTWTALGTAPHKLAIVLRTTGAYVLNRASSGWRLVFPTPWAVTSPVYAAGTWMNSNLNTNEFELFSAANLKGLWATANGLDTLYSGAVAAATEFVHQADTWLQFTLTTLPSSGTIDLEFRRTDSNNCWRASISSAGTMTLYEVVAGTPTSRGSGTVSAGNVITMSASGAAYTMHDSVASRIDYSGSAQWQQNTGGLVASLGTGGVISNLRVIPVAVPGKEGRMLDRLVS